MVFQIRCGKMESRIPCSLLWHKDPEEFPGMMCWKWPFINNADLARTIFYGESIGMVEPGAQADLIMVDFHPFTPLTPDNCPGIFCFGFHESMITPTMVAGQLLMKDRTFLTVDPEEIFRKALEIAPLVWRNYAQQF